MKVGDKVRLKEEYKLKMLSIIDDVPITEEMYILLARTKEVTIKRKSSKYVGIDVDVIILEEDSYWNFSFPECMFELVGAPKDSDKILREMSEKHYGIDLFPKSINVGDILEKSEGMKAVNYKIENTFNTIRDQVIQKNIDYNNSLQNPIGVFQKNTLDGIKGRIDDKLNRIIACGLNDKTEDTICDLIGYLVHLKIALAKEK